MARPGPMAFMVLALAFVGVTQSPAEAGEVRGVLRVPSAIRAASANPYPGQVRAAAGSERAAAGPATPADAVVSLAPAGDSQRPPQAKAARPTRHVELRQRGQAFVPRVLPIRVGTVVDFPNDDPFYHNVFSYSSAKRFDLGRYGKGKSRSETFEQPGLVKVFCDIHSDMAAYILVLETPHFTVPENGGEFAISDVPAGTYLATAWHPDLAPWTGTISVPAEGAVTLEIDLR